MPDEESEERGFTIVDRRGQDEDETPQAPADADATPDAGGAKPDDRGVKSDDGAEGARSALPPVDFPSFLISLGTSALYHLGLVPDPATGEPAAPNLEMARHTIDTIELLQEKTKGNLSTDEEGLFQNLLTELRMRFVEVSQAPR